MTVANRTGAKVSDPRPYGLDRPTVFGEVCLTTGAVISGVPTSPTLSSGTGAPTHTRPNGSMYFRTDGAADTSLYQRISGAWVAIEHTGGDIHVPDDADIYFGDDNDATIGYNDVADNLVITMDNGDLVVSTTTAGEVVINGVGGLDIDTANALALDVAGASTIALTGAVGLTLGAGMDLTGDVEFQDSGVLAFGDDADVTLTHDGTDTVDVAGTMRWGDDNPIAFGDDEDGYIGYANALHLVAMGGPPVVDVGTSGDTADVLVQSGPFTVNDATGSPATGDLLVRSGTTNCTDGAGTGGDSGAVTVQTGDADSDAGTSGSSGILSLVTGFSDDADSGNVVIGSGSAGVDSGDVYIDVGAAGGTPGDVVIGTTATLIALDAVTKFRAGGGADAANAVLGGVGTTVSPATTSVAGANMFEFRVQSTATSDDFRGFRLDADFNGAGVSGDAVRGRALVSDAVAGTVDGGAFTLEYNGGSVTGQGMGCRSNVVFPDAAVNGGTVYGGMSEFALGGTSFVNGLTAHALHAFSVIGADAATRNAQVLNLFEVSGVTSTSGGLFYANTAAVPGNANASLRVMCPDGTVRHILLFDNEA